MQDLFTQALGINSPWFIKDVSFDNKQLNIHIDFKKGTKYNKALSLECGYPKVADQEQFVSNNLNTLISLVHALSIITTAYLSFSVALDISLKCSIMPSVFANGNTKP
jgi:hypothetical protein